MCGWPLRTGDMYGGGHYVESASANLTPQGRAILQASTKFGDGRTLPFLPCKRFYNPFAVDGTRLFACRLHSNLRRKRLEQEGWKWRDGEKHLDDFWNELKTVKVNSKKIKVDEDKSNDAICNQSSKKVDVCAAKELEHKRKLNND